MAKRKSPSKGSKANGQPRRVAETDFDPLAAVAPELGSKRPSIPFPIVGVGASAGGLEALSELVANLPDRIDFAVAVVQHLAPDRKSGLPELLALKTSIAVQELTPDRSIEPNCIYIVPPNVEL